MCQVARCLKVGEDLVICDKAEEDLILFSAICYANLSTFFVSDAWAKVSAFISVLCHCHSSGTSSEQIEQPNERNTISIIGQVLLVTKL